MSKINSIKLEILRAGPAHNQLLSPLTPYLAVCRNDGPVTINLPFEQRQLIMRLERLRYYSGTNRIPDRQREAELRELGEILGNILEQIPALISALGQFRVDQGVLVHLRLSFSAQELALLPFECAIATDGFPGSGSSLLLQSRLPVTLTREVPNGQGGEIRWNRTPRILFAYAAPGGLAPVPFGEHLLALRQAIDPWVSPRDSQDEQVKEVSKILTVLPDATLSRIRQACAETEYTHVHILGHGAEYEEAGEKRYGLALGKDNDWSGVDVVDGERLAIALTARGADLCDNSRQPTVVTLATCDSANVAAVLSPGGSIAHALHAAGIPWVFASQFPLWMRSSTIFVSIVYQRLLHGGDPRCALYELRRRLRSSCPDTHDWASIVAYASVPPDFDIQISAFQDSQYRSQINAKLDWADRLVKTNLEEQTNNSRPCDIDALSKVIRQSLCDWPKGCESCEKPNNHAERLGVSGACEKRIGIFYAKLAKQADDKTVCDLEAKRNSAFKASYEYYKQALGLCPGNHWYITQFLSMKAVLAVESMLSLSELKQEGSHWWRVATEIAQQELEGSGDKRAWAYSSLIELEVLGRIYGELSNAESAGQSQTLARLLSFCEAFVRLTDGNSFSVQATIRQFRRYHDYWQRPEWDSLVNVALEALGEPKANPKSEG